MLDRWQLVYGALWILGLALAVAAWSYVRWWARHHQVQLRQAARLPLFVIPFCAGLALFSLGLALGGRTWWETAVWTVLCLLSVIEVVCSVRQRKRQRHTPDAQPSPEQRRSA